MSPADREGAAESPPPRALPRWEGEPPEVWAGRWGIPAFEAWASLPSTNDRVRRLVEAGAAPFTAVTAEEQTAGRGREGRPWSSPSGRGLWLSILVDPPVPGAAALLPLRAGLATAAAIESLTGLGAGLKWPNDVLCGGRKVAGVLCEGHRDRVVVGIGINVRQEPADFPPGLRDRAASLAMHSEGAVSRAELAGSVVHELVRRAESGGAALDPWEARELAARDLLEGRRVVLSTGIRGRAEGVDPDGALRVAEADGRTVRVLAGSVVEWDPPGDGGAVPGRG